MSSQVYENLHARCDRPILDPRWSFVDTDPDAGVLNMDHPAVLESLRDEFEDDDIIESKVAIRTDGTIALNPVFATDDKMLMVLRDSDGHASDIMTSVGTLKHSVPLFSCVQDRQTQQSLGSTGRRLFAVSTMQELMLFRALRLPATLMEGMDSLNEFGLGKLFGLLDGFRSGAIHSRRLDGSIIQMVEDGAPRRTGTGLHCVTLVLVGIDLVTGKKRIPPKIFSVARYLNAATEHLGLDWRPPKVWWPAEQERAALEFQRYIRGAGLVWRFIKGIKELHDLSNFTNPKELPGHADPLAVAERKLLKTQREARFDSDSQYRQQKYQEAFAEYVELIDCLVTGPLLKSGEKSQNLALRLLRFQQSGVGRSLLLAFPGLQVALEDRLGASPFLDGGFLPEGAWEDMKALSDQLLKIIREETNILNVK